MKRSLLSKIRALGSHKIRHLSIDPPSPERTRKGLAIVLIVRNGEHYLPEWLAFHISAGVSHFFVYDNQSDDGTEALLCSPMFRDRVTVTKWAFRTSDPDTGRKIHQQTAAYAHAIQTFGGHCERMAFIDLDEFLVPTGGGTLLEAALAAGDASNISLPWHMFGHNGHKRRPDGFVTESFTERAPMPASPRSPLTRFKCIVDPSRVTGVGVHSFVTSDLGRATANSEGTIVPHSQRRNAEFYTSKGIQLNHYYLLSEEDLAEKLERGPVGHASQTQYRQRVNMKRDEIERSPIQDHRARDFFRNASHRALAVSLPTSDIQRKVS